MLQWELPVDRQRILSHDGLEFDSKENATLNQALAITPVPEGATGFAQPTPSSLYSKQVKTKIGPHVSGERSPWSDGPSL